MAGFFSFFFFFFNINEIDISYLSLHFNILQFCLLFLFIGAPVPLLFKV